MGDGPGHLPRGALGDARLSRPGRQSCHAPEDRRDARPLIDALRLACADLIDWMATDYGFDKMEAYQVLGQAAEIEVANVVDPQYSVACVLDKRYLPK